MVEVCQSGEWLFQWVLRPEKVTSKYIDWDSFHYWLSFELNKNWPNLSPKFQEMQQYVCKNSRYCRDVFEIVHFTKFKLHLWGSSEFQFIFLIEYFKPQNFHLHILLIIHKINPQAFPVDKIDPKNVVEQIALSSLEHIFNMYFVQHCHLLFGENSSNLFTEQIANAHWYHDQKTSIISILTKTCVCTIIFKMTSLKIDLAQTD